MGPALLMKGYLYQRRRERRMENVQDLIASKQNTANWYAEGYLASKMPMIQIEGRISIAFTMKNWNKYVNLS